MYVQATRLLHSVCLHFPYTASGNGLSAEDQVSDFLRFLCYGLSAEIEFGFSTEELEPPPRTDSLLCRITQVGLIGTNVSITLNICVYATTFLHTVSSRILQNLFRLSDVCSSSISDFNGFLCFHQALEADLEPSHLGLLELRPPAAARPSATIPTAAKISTTARLQLLAVMRAVHHRIEHLVSVTASQK